jgi:hypothetical protein
MLIRIAKVRPIFVTLLDLVSRHSNYALVNGYQQAIIAAKEFKRNR